MAKKKTKKHLKKGKNLEGTKPLAMLLEKVGPD